MRILQSTHPRLFVAVLELALPVPNRRMPIMSFGLLMSRCCINEYAHLSAAIVAESAVSGFFSSESSGLASMLLLTSMAKSTASLVVL